MITMRIDARTKLYGLFGYPVRHSLSPTIHNRAFEKLRINAIYVALEVRPERLTQAVEAIRAFQIGGINVTIPHKQKIIPLLDELSQEATLFGAVNTVVNKDGRLIGHNTDGAGFLTSLKKEAGINAKDKSIFILGAGGAARALGFSLARVGAKEIKFFDIVKHRARTLAKDIKRNFPACSIQALDNIREIDADILINATPVGLKKGDPLPVDLRLLRSEPLVCDLIYNPPRTKFVNAARRKGLKTMNGLGMFLYQGLLSFKLWTGRMPSIQLVRQAVKLRLLT